MRNPTWTRRSWPVLPDLQARLARALFQPSGTPAEPALAAAFAADGAAAEARLAVYRNNVQASLIEVLRAAFPATARLAGAENFAFAARRFIAQHPPREARLLAYGSGFPAWLADFGPARPRPWLAEMARLEWARNEALFAADADPLDPKVLTETAPEAIAGLTFVAHPATRLVASDFALDALWRAQAASGPMPDPRAAAETVLVLRPALEVTQLLLPAGEAALATALLAGETLAAAAEAALAVEPALDLQAALYRHLHHGSFSGYRLPGGASGHPGEE